MMKSIDSNRLLWIKDRGYSFAPASLAIKTGNFFLNEFCSKLSDGGCSVVVLTREEVEDLIETLQNILKGIEDGTEKV